MSICRIFRGGQRLSLTLIYKIEGLTHLKHLSKVSSAKLRVLNDFLSLSDVVEEIPGIVAW